jgi:hypothetical protein
LRKEGSPVAPIRLREQPRGDTGPKEY